MRKVERKNSYDNSMDEDSPEEKEGAWYWWRKDAQSDMEPCRVFCGNLVMLCGDGKLYHTDQGFLTGGEWCRLEEPSV